jgi:hypothetical protein
MIQPRVNKSSSFCGGALEEWEFNKHRQSSRHLKVSQKNPEPETLKTANDLTMFLLRSPQEAPGNNDPTTGQQEQ